MHALIDQENLLWRGPYLSLQRPYEQDAERNNKELRPDGLCEEAIWYRRDIREPRKLPNILMTNYSMLEYLLLRKFDRILFDEHLRFLVLDEVHTYHGARGIEVACL